MHCISIQIQPDCLANFDRHEFLLRVRAAGRSPEIDTFQEKGVHYLHFNFFTEQPKLLWQELQTALYSSSEYGHIIGSISIAICDNENENDALLVLHHFDSNEKIDSLK
jgi:hypothetical protein